jgi:L-alanine-DL-glutamate epimerase-like enolase superfamily enzyme
MLIADLKVFVLEPFGPLVFWEGMPPTYYNAILFQVIADNGETGNCITWIHGGVGDIIEQLPYYKDIMIGKDPHYIEQFIQTATNGMDIPNNTASAFDIATWDLLGKLHNEPIYKLLGAYRDKLPAYASTFSCNTDEEYIEMALKAKKQGFHGFKMHPYCIPDEDIRLCRKVREAVGPDFPLMIDSVYKYNRIEL